MICIHILIKREGVQYLHTVGVRDEAALWLPGKMQSALLKDWGPLKLVEFNVLIPRYRKAVLKCLQWVLIASGEMGISVLLRRLSLTRTINNDESIGSSLHLTSDWLSVPYQSKGLRH